MPTLEIAQKLDLAKAEILQCLSTNIQVSEPTCVSVRLASQEKGKSTTTNIAWAFTCRPIRHC